MTDLALMRTIEAVLFAADAPVALDKMCVIVGDAERGDIRQAVDSLAGHYDEEGHAFTVAEVAGGWQLYARPEYSKWIRELHKGRIPARLSQAALETLAIVAYKQPIVRAEVEIIRGVDSSGVLSTLLRRDLITIAGRAPGMGRALMYRTTKEFLRYFGLNAITDLPRLEEFAEVLGLKPEELELAIEGAESMAGMVAGEGADEFGDADAEILENAGIGAVTLADEEPSETAAPQRDVDEEPTAPEIAGRTFSNGSANVVGDRELLDKIDEA